MKRSTFIKRLIAAPFAVAGIASVAKEEESLSEQFKNATPFDQDLSAWENQAPNQYWPEWEDTGHWGWVANEVELEDGTVTRQDIPQEYYYTSQSGGMMALQAPPGHVFQIGKDGGNKLRFEANENGVAYIDLAKLKKDLNA